MADISELVTRLISAGTPPEVAAVVVAEAFAAGVTSTGIPPDSAAEKRRAYDRERKKRDRKSGGIPPDSTGGPQSAPTSKNINTKSGTTKHLCPPDWKPSEAHFALADELKIPRSAVENKAAHMRLWSKSGGEKKSDWDATFESFLRRDASKLAAPAAAPAKTITPDSPSWNAWKSYFRDAGKQFQAGYMDKAATEGKPFTVASEWPPGTQ